MIPVIFQHSTLAPDRSRLTGYVQEHIDGLISDAPRKLLNGLRPCDIHHLDLAVATLKRVKLLARHGIERVDLVTLAGATGISGLLGIWVLVSKMAAVTRG